MSMRRSVARLVPDRVRRRLRSTVTSDGKVHWCRVVMNREVERYIRALDCPSMDCLEISGTAAQTKYPFKSYRSVAYPTYDVCQEPLERGAFDLVIAEQVLEHVTRPDLAVVNVYEMLRPNGVFVVSTPFLLKVHAYPLDLYRWTEQGMAQLLRTAGLSDIVTGSWGNRDCLAADLTADLKWTWYDPLAHSLRNEPQFPIVVWAFARRSENAGD